MRDDPYTLTELARLADVTPRTVRYYVQRGLLPSPRAAGRATRYGDPHLLRLRLIRRLQREHLPLAEIRARLEQMGDAQVEAAMRGAAGAAPPPVPSTDETLAFVRALMTRAGVAPRFYSTSEPPPDGTRSRPVPDEFPIRESPGDEPPAGSPVPGRVDPGSPVPGHAPALPLGIPLVPGRGLPVAAPGDASARPVADRSTWERIAITPDVEIHVRRPLDRPRNKRVEQLIRIARELFEEDG